MQHYTNHFMTCNWVEIVKPHATVYDSIMTDKIGKQDVFLEE